MNILHIFGCREDNFLLLSGTLRCPTVNEWGLRQAATVGKFQWDIKLGIIIATYCAEFVVLTWPKVSTDVENRQRPETEPWQMPRASRKRKMKTLLLHWKMVWLRWGFNRLRADPFRPAQAPRSSRRMELSVVSEAAFRSGRSRMELSPLAVTRVICHLNEGLSLHCTGLKPDTRFNINTARTHEGNPLRSETFSFPLKALKIIFLIWDNRWWEGEGQDSVAAGCANVWLEWERKIAVVNNW